MLLNIDYLVTYTDTLSAAERGTVLGHKFGLCCIQVRGSACLLPLNWVRSWITWFKVENSGFNVTNMPQLWLSV